MVVRDILLSLVVFASLSLNIGAGSWEVTSPQSKSSSIEYCPSDYKDSKKFCNLRNSYYSRKFWNHWAGYLCYKYTNEVRLQFKYPVDRKQFTCEGKSFFLPAAITNATNEDGDFIFFDYKNTTSQNNLRPSFKTENYYKLWEDCCSEAENCCDNLMTNENILPSVDYPCPVIWDGWTCFPHAKAKDIVEMPCSSQAYSSNSKVCQLESEKECFANGTWNQITDYQACAIGPVLRVRHNFHVYVLGAAAIIATPAVIIFSLFRNLRKNTRLRLHRNLIFAIIVRNILTIMTKELIILDALKPKGSHYVMEDNGAPCRLLALLENLAKNAIYACMLVDGFYLHKLIVRIFAPEPNVAYLYITVLVLSVLPSAVWGALRFIHGGASCWMVDNTGDQWIPDGIRMAILAINTLFLLDIIRVMILKLRHGNVTRQAKATFRATLFLIPLFGVHIIVIANRNIVTSNTCTAEDVYYFVSYSLEGLQGVMVTILFCYLSSEVHHEFDNAFRKLSIHLQEKYGWNLRRESVSRRRTTAATYVGRSSIQNQNFPKNPLEIDLQQN